ncbi:vesicle coat component [Cadophora gregata]|uniref:vesicle coat component n=1 Tax=Cadophora gregata TaxID=51156 RepID=UPI0026DB3788|nr:vesicle coat component [Cadophora gregata]KAK0101171.1 vesicle coat component [Cadophora gregata f. sp. sojae]KAK0115796.1 vesicle coat component [Cadophora gregata]
MMAESAHASWHPAFMPNSTPQTIATAAPEVPSSLVPTSEPPFEYKSEPTPIASNPVEVEAVEEIPAAEGQVPQDNNDHPELGDLRNALATSLASPGGVELEESPWHNGTEQQSTEAIDKADFPSEGPHHENKHLSTMSFARTVSEEVNWGEDDDVDPQWNTQRTDTDPFKFMAKSDRTNSFPQVPPAHSVESGHDQTLPHSQAEDILHEVEQEVSEDLFGDEENDPEAGFFAQKSGQEEGHLDFSHGMDDDELRLPDYGQTYGGDVRPEQDEELEARFEEGLPLVQTHEDSTYQPEQSNSNDLFADEAGEEDFFTQVTKGGESQELVPEPYLERKSTMHVIDSLHYQPHEQIHDSIQEENAMESSQSSLERSTGGGIAASPSTVLSAVFGNPDSPVHEQTDLHASEEDLAAKWKAALAGDEFLADDDDELLPDDDELLPDDNEPTESAGFDPATVFGSDDEGFLEDNDQNGESLFGQQTSPPIPTPVTGPNSHVVGFDILGGAQTKRPTSSSNKYLPPGAVAMPPVAPKNAYAPTAPLLTDLSKSTLTPAAVSPYMSSSMASFQPQPPRPEMPKAQSFADKAKGGYASPYDLPMDVVKPRKRVSMQTMNRTHASAEMAPPRSSSMQAPPPPPRAASAGISPPTSSYSQPSQMQPGAQAQLPKTVRKTQSGFFEELPMSKPKLAVRHSSGLPSPLQSPYGQPGVLPPPTGPPRSSYGPPPVQQLVQHQPVQPQQPAQVQGLVAPERVSPYASLPSGNIPVPAVASRYSPAPPPLQHSQTAPPPVAQSRYSPAPSIQKPATESYTAAPVNAQPPQSAPILPHQPRTSSPLAHFERSHELRSHGSFSESGSFDRRTSSSGYESGLRNQHLPPTREVEEEGQISPTSTRNYGELQSQYNPSPHLSLAHRPSQTPPPQNLASRLVSSPPKRSTTNYMPQQSSHGQPQPFVPPQRSQTQSPGTAFAGPRLEMSSSVPYQRPASVELPASPRVNNSYQSVPASSSQGRTRGFSQGLNYVAPTDGREIDPLQRWRGAPVFAWGVGGSIMTSFPQDIPRYGMNSQAMIIRSPGTVKIRNIKDLDPLQERLASFPGPLKGKSKKKEVSTWLASGIEILEQNASYLRTVSSLSHEDKRVEERILLWKILQVFIENDGVLEGTSVVDKAVRAVLSPGIDDDESSSAPLYATGADLSGISHSSNSTTRADPVDPAAVDQLRKHLLRGEREKAVWDAVDKRLWAHAMLISNTVSKELYKQVAQEFIQKEVKIIGDNVEPLAALYEIFAGNFEESIDELVPPSARAGFQMVSTSNGTGPSKDALDGLDRWRETLGLVLSNRSIDDSKALNALGKLLSGYGRAEAAHICFLFARSLSIFGGVDDPQASIVLVGSDQLRQPYDFDRELEPVLLSEVFEYGMSLSSTSTIAISSPHLAIYKLQHAKILAEYGFRDKALQYCEAIAASITSQTRRSPYHHGLLVSELEDLSKRLKQSPKDENSSWISKPSIDKAKGSVWATFNKFVAGDEADAASAASVGGAADIGPFSRIAGGTPTISRSPSNADLYGSYPGGSGINGSAPVPITKASSRYAPGASSYGNQDGQTGTSYGSQPRQSLDERSSSEYKRYEPQRQMSDYRPNSQPAPANSYTPQTGSSFTPQSAYTPFGNSSPYESASGHTPQTPVTEQPPANLYASPQAVNSFDGHRPSYAPSEPSYQQPTSSFDSPLSNSYDPPATSAYEPPATSSYDPSATSGYEPPASSSYQDPSNDEPQSSGYQPYSGGYEPPSSGYVPYEPNDEPDSPVEPRPKKKSFMDDDDDDIPGLKAAPASTPREKTKAEKDKEADEAFRKAAEADAQKAKEAAPAKKGWGLGGWFGGAKKESQDMGANPNKPIRAKLGEASSFYYDPELKRWVNKKAGAEDTQAKSATPPPPRAAGPPRTASAPVNMGPPTGNGAAGGPPASVPRPIPTPGNMGPGMGPQMVAQRAVSDNTHSPHHLVSSSPQSDDGSVNLNAPPLINRSQSNGSLRSSGPPSRPGTGMSNASSIDDLLGPPVPRSRKDGAGGAAKKGAKKKGRGYVDVMGDKGA